MLAKAGGRRDEEMNAKEYGCPLGVIKMIWNYTVVITTQMCKYTKTELYTLKVWSVYYMNYYLNKVIFKTFQ